MLNIFKEKQNNINDRSLSINHINKEKNDQINNKFKKDKYNNIIYYPSSSKEWFSSVYSFNKSYSKLNKLFGTYCNMLQNKIKVLFKRRRDNKSRYSANKIYVSRAELKHTNTKLLIILYTYNKQRLSIERYIRKLVTFTKINKMLVEDEMKYVITHKNRVIHLLKNKFFVFKKWRMAFFVLTNNLLNYLVINIKRKKLYKVPTYNIRLLKKFFKLQKVLFNYTKIVNFNKSKFN